MLSKQLPFVRMFNFCIQVLNNKLSYQLDMNSIGSDVNKCEFQGHAKLVVLI